MDKHHVFVAQLKFDSISGINTDQINQKFELCAYFVLSDLNMFIPHSPTECRYASGGWGGGREMLSLLPL